MDITSKIKVELSVADTEELLKIGVANMLNSKYSMSIKPIDLKISFKAGRQPADQMDRGSGAPIFTGATVEIKPLPQSGNSSHDYR